MSIQSPILLSDILSIISLVLIVIGGLFTLYQWRKNMLLKRAGYINELTEKIRSDNDIKDTVYLIDYDLPWYSINFHGCGEDERKMDKTLSYFSYICYLKKQKIITEKEFRFFEYEVISILKNKQIRNYFYNLYHYSQRLEVPFTFSYLLEYGFEQGYFEPDFYDKYSCIINPRYDHNLNF